MIGKSIFVWGIDAPYWHENKIMGQLQANGFESAILHDTSVWAWQTGQLAAPRLRLIKLLKAAGIKVVGCAAVYGNDPAAEGRIAAELCETYALDAFVFDAESAWDEKTAADSNAVKLLQTFRKGTDTKSGWCWWARWKSPITGSQWHPKKVLWAAMTERYGDADFGVPMAYWSGSTVDAAEAIAEQTFSQWREITNKPLVPAGRAYDGDGGVAKPESVTAFDKRARELGAVGITWWALQYAAKIPGVWEAVAAVKPFGETVPTPQPEPEPEPELTDKEKLDILWQDFLSRKEQI